ncbi:MBL fold metallo-hydrolase [Egibacter rhizosphaerae]|uniref:MBL fold metallo-hydrolase n=1 Tax=Egibacter rhizosphaerae TaxID=1670831 RepID=UPI0013F17B50|nr:MBL fold metallo-hydrolase [Egibacter rhizosphaerae]
MRITKYPQSCLVIEKDDGGRLLLDPGLPAVRAYDVDAFGSVDAVLYTHRHPDHWDPDSMRELIDRHAEVYGNADLRVAAGDEPVQPLDDGDEADVAGYTVRAIDLEHMPMVNGAPGPQNTAFLIDGTLLHPGDGLDASGLRAPLLAVPLAGPSASMRDAYRLTEQVGARQAIAIHYDVFPSDPERFARECDVAEVVVLDDGQAVDLSG